MEIINPTQTYSINIEEEMKSSYLDYAMSVIIGRALPDVRDGLKPVHRRVLYAMSELNNVYNKAHKKSARIVGEVIGKYHPHGDTAVYDTIVRMAQEFSMRVPLVDGQGNFGSIDGDSPAAMRYTEVRMSRVAGELLADLDKDTVDFLPNYDDSLTEPVVMPTRVPNLLVNGTSGIAVGMATNIPPHNLGEVVEALLLMLDNPSVPLPELMSVLPGPDFPTSGIICGNSGIVQAYSTGRGIIRIRAKLRVESTGKDREALIVEELPYQVNKARLIINIARLVNEKKITGISDLRDESSREGIRIVIELKRGESPEVVENNLYKMTAMQTSFGMNLLALVDGQPKVMSLSEILAHFLAHRREVIRRRTAFELTKAERRAHILEGLKVALDNLDQVISLIRASSSPAEAKESLISALEFTDAQAQAILEMRLQRLTALEREKILEEYHEILKIIERLREILSSEQVLKEVIRTELQEIRDTYANDRLSEIREWMGDFNMEDLIPEEQVVITATRNRFIKRTPLDEYRSQARGGKGRRGMTTRTEEDAIDYLFTASTHSYLLIFTNKGRVYWLKVYEIPSVGAAGKGRSIVNLLNLDDGEQVADILAVNDFRNKGHVVIVSRKGYIKKTELKAYSRPRSSGIIACAVDEGDELLRVDLTEGERDIILCTRFGKAIRFSESDIRPMGRLARGVKGMTLRPGDEIVSMCISSGDNIDLLSVTENGYGKRTELKAFRTQRRGGQGVFNISTNERNGNCVGNILTSDGNELILITEKGKIIRLDTGDIRRTASRSAQGVRMIVVESDDRVADLSLVETEKVIDEDEEEL